MIRDTVYMLYDPEPTFYGRPVANPTTRDRVFLGGGSSSSPLPRVYTTREAADRARKRYFPSAVINIVHLEGQEQFDED